MLTHFITQFQENSHSLISPILSKKQHKTKQNPKLWGVVKLKVTDKGQTQVFQNSNSKFCSNALILSVVFCVSEKASTKYPSRNNHSFQVFLQLKDGVFHQKTASLAQNHTMPQHKTSTALQYATDVFYVYFPSHCEEYLFKCVLKGQDFNKIIFAASPRTFFIEVVSAWQWRMWLLSQFGTTALICAISTTLAFTNISAHVKHSERANNTVLL